MFENLKANEGSGFMKAILLLMSMLQRLFGSFSGIVG